MLISISTIDKSLKESFSVRLEEFNNDTISIC